MRARPTVYPRACGGTVQHKRSPLFNGLSPRVRGNRVNHFDFGYLVRGLSPRVRGNPTEAHYGHGGLSPRASPCLRSIPARAGEPSCGIRAETVYPRACGGTLQPISPCNIRHGSIPARAGEPPIHGSPSILFLTKGLSPRVRGNQPSADRLVNPIRSIYPRACGGTYDVRPSRWHQRSIPARAGEPSCRADESTHGISGSIPARAGEPFVYFACLNVGWSIPARAGEPAHSA